MSNNILSDEELTALNDELTKSQADSDKTEAETKKLEQDLKNIENLEKLHQDIEGFKSQLADLQASFEKVLEDKETLKKQRDELKNKIDEHEKSTKLTDAEKAKNDAASAVDECNSRLEKANPEGLRKQRDDYNHELENQNERKNKYIRVKQFLTDYLNKKQIIENKSVELEELKNHFNICEGEFQASKTAFEAKDSEYQVQKNMVADFMKSLRSKLEEGKPCPLCGSTTHQYHDETVVSSLFKTIETAWNEARNAFEKAKDAKNKAEGEINLLNKSINNEQSLLNNLVKQLENECNGKPIYDMNLLDKGLSDCESKILAEKTKITEINVKIQAADAIVEELKKLQQKKNRADEAYNSLLRQLTNEWKKLNDDYSKVDAEIVKIDEIANGIKRIEGFERVDEFKGKVAVRNNIDKNSLISGFSKVVFNLIEKSNETQVIENQLGEIDKAQTLRALEALRALRAAQSDAISELKAKISLNAQNSNQAQAAKDDLQAKTALLALWTQLATAIGTTATDNFRDVAQAYTMRILLDQANYFLRKLSQRYELTCYSNSLAIMVMDKDMGGELRSASSLSGGETFLVSLALALGLASLNDENLNIDMLFIDEGFGTLDGESLEMAVQALGNMQKFGKKVGIISHVDSLKERIPAQIRVTKRGKAASEVVVVKA